MRLLGLVVVMAVALPAAAAPPATAPSTAGATATTPDPARDHYERGLAKYNLAEFDAAIAEFKESYELSKAPRLLFNIAQAYRLKKDYASALYFYNTYLRAEPNPPNREDVDAKIDEMKRAVDEQQRNASAATAPAGGALAAGSSGPASASTSGSGAGRRGEIGPGSRRTLRAAGIALAAIGVASAAVGGGMLGLSSADARNLHQVAVAGMPWTAADQARFDQGQRADTAGIVMLSVGGALVLGGGITLAVALRR
jgi:tetratricopeptide (TPR) repeat protein